MPERLKSARLKAVGAKQTLRALRAGYVQVVYVACDADPRVVRTVIETASQMGIELVEVSSMILLGRLCCIEVGAACAAPLLDVSQRQCDA